MIEPIYNDPITPWEDLGAFRVEHEDCFSNWFLEYISQIKSEVIKYIRFGFNKNYNENQQYFLRRFSYYLAETNDIIKSVFYTNGFKGRIGLEYSKAQLKIYFKENKLLPTIKNIDKGFGIIAAMSKGYWDEFGIKSWNELLKDIFEDINLERNIYKGADGLEKAKFELLDFYEENKKIPTSIDFETMYKTILRGEWKLYSINTWNDILETIFNDVNIGKYTGRKGLNKSKKFLLDFYVKHSRLPTTRDPEIFGIRKAVARGEWTKYGIISWNYLLEEIFKKVNNDINKYKGKNGLNCAIKEMKLFFEINERKPKAKDKKIGSIIGAIHRGEWKEFNIQTYNDLLKLVFNETNHVKFIGEEGLEYAKRELHSFYSKNNRKPKYRDQGFRGIKEALFRKEWSSNNINSWNDLLEYTFGIANNKYFTGKKGLTKAIKDLEEFFDKNNRKPTSRDNSMASIISAIYRGEWEEFGIFKWNDLIKLTFKEINHKRKQIKSIQEINENLDRDKEKLIAFYQKHNRIPTTKDIGMSTLSSCISRGKYRVLGIHCWNDLLKIVFNEITRTGPSEKYNGISGFELAQKELLEFFSENGRKPVTRDKGMCQIRSACRSRKWISFGVESWGDIISLTFK